MVRLNTRWRDTVGRNVGRLHTGKMPLIEEASRTGRAQTKADFTGRHACKLETAVFELAEDFGLSPAFIVVRLRSTARSGAAQRELESVCIGHDRP